MKIPSLLACLLLAQLGCSSNKDTCQPIGCKDGVTVDLQTTDGKRFAAGMYTIKVVANGGESAISCTVPVSGAGTCSAGSSTKLGVTSDGTHFVVELLDSPESITVRLESAGKTIGEQTFSPAYTAQKAGPYDDCPVCQHATQTVTIKP